MNFKTFYNLKLFEDNVKYPLLQDLNQGGRLFYMVGLNVGPRDIIKLARITPQQDTYYTICKLFKNEEVEDIKDVVQDISYKQVVQKIIQSCKDIPFENSFEHLQDVLLKFRAEIAPLQHVPGRWCVFTFFATESEDPHTTTFFAVLEVDKVEIKSAIIQKDLEGVDTSGFESLL